MHTVRLTHSMVGSTFFVLGVTTVTNQDPSGPSRTGDMPQSMKRSILTEES